MPKPAKKIARKTASGEVVIPDKLYFRIGEVGRLCGLPCYVLRFWETEFPQLKPSKGSTGQRMYRRVDVENVLRVKKLLYEEGFTIVGANKHIKEFGIDALMSGKSSPKNAPSSSERAPVQSPAIDGQARRVLNEVRRDLESIHKILED